MANKGFIIKPKNFGLSPRSKRGFTLIELVVSLTLFSMVVLVLSSMTISLIKAQRKAFALQNIQENGRYIMETMAKEIRTSIIDSLGGPSNVLNIENSKNIELAYEFNNGNGILFRDGDPLNDSSDIEITGSFFIKKGIAPSRASVTIVMELKSAGTKPEENVKIDLQNTITSRQTN